MTIPASPRWPRRAALLALGLAAAFGAAADNRQPVRILVGFAAGGGVDALARVLARYSEALRVALMNEKVREWLQTLGTTASWGNGEALAQSIQRISDTWGPMIRQSGFQPQ